MFKQNYFHFSHEHPKSARVNQPQNKINQRPIESLLRDYYGYPILYVTEITFLDFIQVQHFGKPSNFRAMRLQPDIKFSCITLKDPYRTILLCSCFVFLFGPCIAPQQINVEVLYLGLISESEKMINHEKSRKRLPHFHVSTV
jgi:hypothetical protein